ncbi:MAG: RluA family pseudouridine synthase, partial [Acidobacteria bacterium]|nr:RluA family pseudouridine synthase [Acidobacteriota bacterium]
MHFTANEDNRGDRLDRFLAGEIADYSRSQIQRLIETGHVTHSRYQDAKSNSDIRDGDVISVVLPAPTATAAQAED